TISPQEKGTISDCGLTENAGDWTVSGSCRIQVDGITNDSYACRWSQSTSGDTWSTSFTADDPEARVNTSGHCIFTRSLPPEEDVYTYFLHYQPAHEERHMVGNITISKEMATVVVKLKFVQELVEEHINILYEDSDLFMKTRQPSCSTTPSALSSPAAPSTSTFTVKTDEQETSFGYSSVELKTDEQTTSFGHASVDNKTDEQKISFGYASVELKTNEEETSAGYASVDSGSPVKSAPRFALVNTDAAGTSAGYSEVELEGSTNAKETAAKSSAVSTERRFVLEDRSGVSLFSPYSDVDPAYASAEDVFPSPPPCSTNRRITIADHSGSGLPSHYVNCPSNFDDTKPPSLCQPFSDANSGAYAVVNKVPKHARASQPPAYEYAKVNKKGRSRSAVYNQVERKKRAEHPPAPDRQSDFVHNVQVETEAQRQPGDIQHVVHAADGGESKDSTLNVEVQQLPSSDVGDVQHKLTGAAREEQHVNESD
ncbi:hypothetical protein BaRGS_00011339, partial [Batillaria attramentaria]